LVEILSSHVNFKSFIKTILIYLFANMDHISLANSASRSL